MRGEVKVLCKAAVALFGIPGEYSPKEIIKHIEWLIGKKGIFRYGGINLKVSCLLSCSNSAQYVKLVGTGSHV